MVLLRREAIYQCQQHGHDVLVDQILGVVQQNFSIICLQNRAVDGDTDTSETTTIS